MKPSTLQHSSWRVFYGLGWSALCLLAWWTFACDPKPPSQEGIPETPAETVQDVQDAAPQDRSQPTDTPDASPQTDLPPTEPLPEPAPTRNYPLDQTLRLNHIQVKGTHNSFHIAPPQGVDEWKYTHKPLDQQLQEQKVRQFELDVFWNEELEAFLVFHIPILDQHSTCYRFTDCLKVIKRWSDVHRQHLPIFVLIEPKGIDKLDPVDAFEKLEKEILSVYPKERLITPDAILGSHNSLKEAVAQKGWPTLAEVRGTLLFSLLVGGAQRSAYTHGDKDLKGRLMFVTADVDNPYAAVVKIDGPLGNEEKIKEAVKSGFLVRTRSDAALEEAAKNDTTRLQAALTSGAHMISTDFPGPVEGTEYVVQFPNNAIALCNPIIAPANCTPDALELP